MLGELSTAWLPPPPPDLREYKAWSEPRLREDDEGQHDDDDDDDD